MTYQVQIHRLVIEEDFKSIDYPQQKKILRTIEGKLAVDPQGFGKPLSGPFKGYWRLRIGDYRAVYRIIKEKVIVSVIKVGIRRDDKIYQELLARLRKLS